MSENHSSQHTSEAGIASAGNADHGNSVNVEVQGSSDSNQLRGIKRNQRHTPEQLQHLEEFFNRFPYPGDMQRKELSRELGVEPNKIKFWFQNKRSHLKTKQQKLDNILLKAENHRLRAMNMQFKNMQYNTVCFKCQGSNVYDEEMGTGDERLSIENAQLQKEIDRFKAIISVFATQPALPYGMGEGPINADMPTILQLARAAMEELVRLAQFGVPLWETSRENGREILNGDEYLRLFSQGTGPIHTGFRCETSRASGVVAMNSTTLTKIFMDASQWATMFCSFVSRATTVEVLLPGVDGTFDGALQLMAVEYHIPTPFVPTRESFFLRYCKKYGEELWAVVDVSLDHLRAVPSMKCHRSPSGCLIEELPNGYSKVIWVEHVDVTDTWPVPAFYVQLINSTLGFGANRWFAALERQCERLLSNITNIIPVTDGEAKVDPGERRNLSRVAERLILSFFTGLSASTANPWTSITGVGGLDVRIMVDNGFADDGKTPRGTITAATSLWLPVLPKKLFEFLRAKCNRKRWDILATHSVEESEHFGNGQDPGNTVSLLEVQFGSSDNNKKLILQETSTDEVTSFIIYSPVDRTSINMVRSGAEPDSVSLIPSGFVILPDGHTGNRAIAGETGLHGSLLTAVFQTGGYNQTEAEPGSDYALVVGNLLSCIVEKIKGGVMAAMF